MHACYDLQFLLFSLSFYFIRSTCTSDVYMVYLGHNPIDDPRLTSESHLQLLLNIFDSEEEARRSLLYSYTYSFSGFSAKLNSSQAATLSRREEVVSVFPTKTLELHTTRSWDFMGLPLEPRYDDDDDVDNTHYRGSRHMLAAFGDDVIVGIIDTGIWPESASFQEEPGMGPIPRTWKGMCEEGEQFNPSTACNRKLIGARHYFNGLQASLGPINFTGNFEYCSARDRLGHGTHTASTAVGSVVRGASFFGLGSGTARGGAPRARLAVYKACWNVTGSGSATCNEGDIMAAFEDALKDGVHLISLSLSIGNSVPPLTPFFNSTLDIGSFHAMQLGVTVVFSAGNYEYSPEPSMVKNVAPWSISVAASTIDRAFPTKMFFDNRYTTLTVMGQSLITTRVNGKLADASIYFPPNGICSGEKWNNNSASNKVILCFSTPVEGTIITSAEAAMAVKKAGGVGLIFVEPLDRQIPDVDLIPSVHVDTYQGTRIRQYLGFSFFYPTVQITPIGSTVGKTPAPVVAYFSCRGPSSLSPDILKPDLSAPGVNILAAWPSNTPPSLSATDTRLVNWTFQSGTSMSCPHVTGAAALIKSIHPDWSPAAIKSALMTTAYTKDTNSEDILSGGTTKGSDPFDIGAGHINPMKALDPGLIYDMRSGDYTAFLCNLGYTQELIKKLVLPGTDTRCPQTLTSNSNLNLPSITVSNLQSPTTLRRTVRNVGRNYHAVYFARVVNPNGVDVTIWPTVLFFTPFKCEHTYYVTLHPRKRSQGRYDFGEIVWSDGIHTVRSPLSVCVNNVGDGTGSTSAHTSL